MHSQDITKLKYSINEKKKALSLIKSLFYCEGMPSRIKNVNVIYQSPIHVY